LILSVGLAALAAAPAASQTPKLDLDFAALDPCPKGSKDEIVVCGSRDRQSPYRLPKLDDQKYKPRRLHPENIVPGGRIHAESSTRPDGLVDKRVMITFTVPF
jgi:hypothetical protein